jgi:Response regulator receiver domain
MTMARTLNYSKIGVVIIDNDPSKVTGLRNYLQIRFGKLLRISTFNTGASALADIDKNTDMVILENYLTGENGTDIRNSIKEKNHSIQVVRLGTKREVGDAVEIYNNGVQRTPSLHRAGRAFLDPVFRVVSYPARIISKEFRVNQFLGIIFTSILFLGILTALFLAFVI